MTTVDIRAINRRPAHGGYPDPPTGGQNEPCPLAVTRDRITMDARFQSACQRYAHGNGSSAAIASAALAAITSDAPAEGLGR